MNERAETTLVQRLRDAMSMRGVGAADLADRSGLSGAYVTHLLTKRIIDPGVHTVASLACALGVPPAWLAYGVGDLVRLGKFPEPIESVYFIRRASDGAIKIGRSLRPSDRLRSLQSGSADQLDLIGVTPGGSAEERLLHRQFAGQRVRGEWFAPSDELSALIASRCAPVNPEHSNRTQLPRVVVEVSP